MKVQLTQSKLGYGGTKAEMERLIADANEYRASIGETANLSIDSFADVVQAVQSVQEAQNIAGTTGKEAMSTIEGSAAAVKAAWENVITAVGRGEGLQDAFDGLVSAFFGESEGEGLLNQIIPRIQTTMEGIADFITTAAPYIADALPALVSAVVPSLVSTAMTLLSTLGNALMDNIDVILFAAGDIIEMLMNGLLKATSGEESVIMDILNWIIGVFNENYTDLLDVGAQILINLLNGFSSGMSDLTFYVTEFISAFGQMLIDNAPALISASFSLISTLASGIGSALPTLIPMAVELLMTLVSALVDPANIGILMQGAVDLIMGLTNGLIAALPVLLGALPGIVTQICAALTGDNLQLLLQATVDIIIAIARAIIENLPLLIESTLEIIVTLVSAIASAYDQFIDAAAQILVGLWNLIVKYGGDFLKKAGEVCKNILDAVVKFLSELPTKMAYWAGYAIGQFIKFFMELPSKIKEIWNNVITGASAFVTDFKNKGVESAKGFFTSIINGIKDLPSKVVEIGSNIVKGIWQGISNGWTWLTDSISNLANNLLQGVKDALGIESPSKEFAWVGKMVDEGFAEGIIDNANLVDSALATLNPSIQGGSVYATLDGNGGGNQSVVMNIYPSAGMNEKDLAREINYKLAEQTARKQAAWRPAYA
jgi:phage-related protein